ncbi:MAG: MSCRAMM family protein [Actinomycetota bacterium]
MGWTWRSKPGQPAARLAKRPLLSLGAVAAAIALVLVVLPQAAFAVQEDYEHWHNAPGHLGWSNGEINNTNSDYAEGDVIPLRMLWSSAESGETLTFSICYEFQGSGGITGHDYLDDVDQTESATLPGGLSATAIPADPDVVAQLGSQPSGSFRHLGFTSFQVSGPAAEMHGDRADKCYTFDVTFGGSDAALYYGAHLARTSQWPAGGASHFSGGQLENRYTLPTSQTDMTRGIMSNAIAPEGALTIVKDAVPDSAQDFAYTTTGTGLSGFSLDDDADPTLPNRQTFSSLDPGSYTVTEPSVSGWSLTALSCTGDTDGGSVASVPNRQVVVDLDDGESITCMFTNTKLGSITIVKDAVPDAAQDFAYTITGSGLSSFSLDDDNDATLANSRTFSGLLPGAYSVTETAVGGWDLTGLTCDDGSTVILANARASIDLAAGEQVTCTFTNTNRGTIIIRKDAIPNSAQDFAYTTTGTGLSGFSLDDDAEATLPNSKTFSGLAPGAYTVTEAATEGWNLTGLSCDDGSTVSLAEGLASIDLAAGETVTCTFTNTKPGSITVVKDAQPDSGQDFSFTTTGTGMSAFVLDDDDDDVRSNTRSFSGLLPGTYTVTEGETTGWELTGIVCQSAEAAVSLGARSATIALAAGESALCTFTNLKPGTIVIDKDAIPDSSQDFSFKGTGTGLSDFVLDDDADVTLSNTRSFTGLHPGTYGVSESAAASWVLTKLACEDPDVTVSLDNRHVDIVLAAGETISCTFTNVKQGSLVIVKDALPNSAQDFSFTATGGGVSSFVLDDDAEATLPAEKLFANLLPGSYSVTESAVPGWVLDRIECNDPEASIHGSSVGVTMGPGEAILCTFTNIELGSVTVTKQTSPSDSQTFALTLKPGTIEQVAGDLGKTTWRELRPGTYELTETLTAEQIADGWGLGPVSCGGASTTSIDNGVRITLDPGQDARCTLTNIQTLVLAEQIFRLPVTGMDAARLLALAVMLISAGVYLVIRRRGVRG